MSKDEIKLQTFEGPLDLLLQLIEQEKLNITDIALSKVTEQFFNHLAKIEDNRSEALADFLVIATKLVYLKSRQLLPNLAPEEEDGVSLADQLKMYKRYVDASHTIFRLWNRELVAYGRFEPPVKPEGFFAPLNAGAADLINSFKNLLRRLKPINPLPQVSIDRTVSVRQKVESIFTALKKFTSLGFWRLLGRQGNKTDAIISFLALLELAKAGKISVNQKRAFEEMEIKAL